MPTSLPTGSSVLRERTPAAFNRAAARSALLSAMPTKAHTHASKLIETLTTIKGSDAQKSKLGGVRRVAVATGKSAAAAASAAAVAPIAPVAALEWEQEKEQMSKQIIALQSQLSDLTASSAAALQSEQSRTAHLESDLAAARETISRLQAEKAAYEASANADTTEERSNSRDASLTSSFPVVVAASSAASATVSHQLVLGASDDDTDDEVECGLDDTVTDISPEVIAASEEVTAKIVFQRPESAAPIAVAPMSPLVEAEADVTAPDVSSTQSPVSMPAAMRVFSPLATADTGSEFAVRPLTSSDLDGMDESTASLNLSLSSAALTPRRVSSGMHHQLPASFLSPKEGGFLSPIARSTPSGADASVLTASAVKIQSLFRGRMERGYLAQETRLAALPLTSPSTPAAATPCAKRQRRLVSPVRIAISNMVLEEDAEMDADRSIGASSTAVPAARALSLKSPTVDVSDDSSATPLGAPLSPTESKRLSSEIRLHRPTLNSLDACWTLRSKAMNRIEELVRERGVHGLSGWPQWKDELAHLQRGMAVQLGDLRSSILREACRLLIALAEASPRDFEDQLAFYAPLLWKSLYVTIKIISTTADETMMEIVNRVATIRTVPIVRRRDRQGSHRTCAACRMC